MHNLREDLLGFIHPKGKKSNFPIRDEISNFCEFLLEDSLVGAGDYIITEYGIWGITFEQKKRHWDSYTTDCGKESSVHDYLLPLGFMTNSLLVYYVDYYRHSLEIGEMNKIKLLMDFKEKGYLSRSVICNGEKFRIVVTWEERYSKSLLDLWAILFANVQTAMGIPNHINNSPEVFAHFRNSAQMENDIRTSYSHLCEIIT